MYKICLAFIGILLICSCKKNSQLGLPIVHIDQGVVSYLGQTQGKFRIFKDSATGQEDSVIISLAQWETETIPEILGPNGEVFPAHQRKIYRLYMEEYDSGFFAAGTGTPILMLGMAFTDTAGLIINQNMYGQPMAEFQRYSTIYAESASLFGITYQDVLKFTFDTGDLEEDFWWAKGIGMIMRRTRYPNSTKTQYLVRYN